MAVGFAWLFSLVCFLMAPCALILAIQSVLPLTPFSFERLLEGVLWASWVVGSLQIGVYFWSWGRNMLANRVSLTTDGVHLLLRANKKGARLDDFIPLTSIAAVTQQRSGNAQVYAVTGRDGSVYRFTSFSFFRPKHIAKLIAAHAGLTLEQRSGKKFG